MKLMTRIQTAVIIGLLSCSMGVLAAKGVPGGGGGGGGAGGGGGDKPALEFPLANSISVGTEITVAPLSVSATSGIAQPTITLISSTFPELTVANVTNIPAGKSGPLFTTSLQLAAWTPTRGEIGTGTVVLSASDGVTSATYVLTITVADAPEVVTGLTASTDGSQITASWQAPAQGGIAPLSYFIQACYRHELRTGFFAAQCDAIGTTSDTSAVFPAVSSDPLGGPYFEILVSPLDSIGTPGPMAQFLMP